MSEQYHMVYGVPKLPKQYIFPLYSSGFLNPTSKFVHKL